METRLERDTMGEVTVPDDALWGAQTQRALANGVGVGRLPAALPRALVQIKRTAAAVNGELGLLEERVAAALDGACAEVLGGMHRDQFPLSPFQTGSGTSSNMNVNEVLANRANELLGGRRGEKAPVHPNDHVNLCQSSNDVFPSAIHLAAATAIHGALLPAAGDLVAALRRKATEFADVVKLGRTHLMDALPVTLGQEFGAYGRGVELEVGAVRGAAERLLELPLGGTAVGTGVNAHPEFAPRAIARLARETGLGFRRAADPFEAQGARGAVVAVSGALRGLAVGVAKIANDLRWMASGPDGGLGEILLPELQPGSSIMPGKVNPVVPEAVLQACAQVIANDVAIAQGGLGGVLELNLMMPLLARNLLEQVDLLAGAARLLADRCVAGIQADAERCEDLVRHSLALVTPLARSVGYDAAARVAKEARRRRVPLLQAALDLGVGDPRELEALLDPRTMLGPRAGS